MVKLFEVKEENLNKNSYKIKYYIDKNKCWICTSHKPRDREKGYPTICRNYKKWVMSRYVYTMFKKEILKKLIIRHTCDNPKCINPDHLILGTHKDNSNDKVERNRQYKPDSETCNLTKLKEEEVIEIYTSDLSCIDLANKFNVKDAVISKIKLRQIWKNTTKDLKLGRKPPLVTDEEKKKIRSSNKTYKELSKIYKISETSIGRIKSLKEKNYE